MNINDLQLLQTLLELKNVSKTAELMHIAQPAVTVKLGKLRDHFKDELLVRKGNTMVLTEKAHALLAPLQQVNRDISDLVSHSKVFDPHDAHSFSLILHEFASDLILEQLVAELLSYNKDHIICIESVSNFYDDIQNRDLNNADLIISDEVMAVDNYYTESLFKDELVLIYDSYFEVPPKSISLDEYLSLPHLIFSKDEQKTNIAQYLGVEDTRNIKARINSIRTAMNLLKNQYVITGAKQFAKLYQLNYVELPFQVKDKGLNFYVPTRIRHTAKSKWLRALCSRIVQDLLH